MLAVVLLPSLPFYPVTKKNKNYVNLIIYIYAFKWNVIAFDIKILGDKDGKCEKFKFENTVNLRQ